MKVEQIYYERTINLGNFENEKIGLTVKIEEGEKPSDALKKARVFIEKNKLK